MKTNAGRSSEGGLFLGSFFYIKVKRKLFKYIEKYGTIYLIVRVTRREEVDWDATRGKQRNSGDKRSLKGAYYGEVSV